VLVRKRLQPEIPRLALGVGFFVGLDAGLALSSVPRAGD